MSNSLSNLRFDWGCSVETNNTTTGPLIYRLLPKLMDRIGAISKDRKNPVGFKYRGIEDALNHLQPALIEFGISIEIECHNLENRIFLEKGEKKDRLSYHASLLMDVTFVAEDGSRSKRTAAGEGIDIAGDKSTNKAMAAAFKYAIFLGLCVPLEDNVLDDPDSTGTKQPAAVQPMVPVQPVVPSLTFAPMPINEGQLQDILILAQGADMPPEVLQAVVAKYGATKLSDLSFDAAQDLIAKLMPMQPASNEVPF